MCLYINFSLYKNTFEIRCFKIWNILKYCQKWRYWSKAYLNEGLLHECSKVLMKQWKSEKERKREKNNNRTASWKTRTCVFTCTHVNFACLYPSLYFLFVWIWVHSRLQTPDMFSNCIHTSPCILIYGFFYYLYGRMYASTESVWECKVRAGVVLAFHVISIIRFAHALLIIWHCFMLSDRIICCQIGGLRQF